jgi:exopolysaccharide production protein ExoQ
MGGKVDDRQMHGRDRDLNTTTPLNQLLGRLLGRLEIGFVIVYLLFAESTTIPSQISVLINALNYLFVGIMVLRLWKKMAYVMTLDLTMLALVGFTIGSLLWSVDVDYSVRMLLGMLRTTLFGIYFATRFAFPEQLRMFAAVSGLIVAINLLVYAIFPSIGIAADPNSLSDQAFVGIYTNKQQTGRVLSLALITLIMYAWAYSRYRWLSILGAAGAIGLLLSAHTSTYVIAVVVAIMLFPLALIAQQRLQLRILLLLAGLLVGVAFAGVMGANWENLATSSGKGLTFNGRTQVWTLAIEQLMKRPVLGYGYAAFWASDEGWDAFRGVTWAWAEYKPAFDVKTQWTAHNGFLDLALQIGLIGLSILVCHIFLMISRSLALMHKAYQWESLWMLQILAIQLVGAGFEPPTYLASNNIHWIVYVAMAYGSAIVLRRIRDHSRSAAITLITTG